MKSFNTKLTDADNKHGIDEAFVKRILSGESLYKLSREKQCSYAFLRLIKQGKIYKDLVNKCGGPALPSDNAVSKVENAKGSSETPERAAEHKEPTHHTQTIASGEHKSLKDVVTNPAELKALLMANRLGNLSRWKSSILRSTIGQSRQSYEYEKALDTAVLVQVKPYKVTKDTPEMVELSVDALFEMSEASIKAIRSFYYGNKVKAELIIEATADRGRIKLKTVGKSKFTWMANGSNFVSRSENDRTAAEQAKVAESKVDTLNKYFNEREEHIKQQIKHSLNDTSKTKFDIEVLDFKAIKFEALAGKNDDSITANIELSNVECLNKATNEHFKISFLWATDHWARTKNAEEVAKGLCNDLVESFIREVRHTSHSTTSAVISDEISSFLDAASDEIEKICKHNFKHFNFSLRKDGRTSVSLACKSLVEGDYNHYVSGKAKNLTSKASISLKVLQTQHRTELHFTGLDSNFKSSYEDANDLQKSFEQVLDIIRKDIDELIKVVYSADSQIDKNKDSRDSRDIEAEIRSAASKSGFTVAKMDHDFGTGWVNVSLKKTEAKHILHLAGKVTLTSAGKTRCIFELYASPVGSFTTYSIERNLRSSLDDMHELIRETLQRKSHVIQMAERSS